METKTLSTFPWGQEQYFLVYAQKKIFKPYTYPLTFPITFLLKCFFRNLNRTQMRKLLTSVHCIFQNLFDFLTSKIYTKMLKNLEVTQPEQFQTKNYNKILFKSEIFPVDLFFWFMKFKVLSLQIRHQCSTSNFTQTVVL